jgi:hypothetical protein
MATTSAATPNQPSQPMRLSLIASSPSLRRARDHASISAATLRRLLGAAASRAGSRKYASIAC